jgi:ribosomal protein L29
MIKDILAELEGSIKAGKKDEALRSVAQLKQELGAVNTAQQELRTQLASFEVTHPDLIKAVDGLSQLLAQIGI